MFKERRLVCRYKEALAVPDLASIQRESFRRFLQPDVDPMKRRNEGLEGLFRETFPVESYDKTVRLEYICYKLGRPRYSIEECRKLGLTYGRPLRACMRLVMPESVREGDVYIGDVPIMIGGGEFIINGSERVVVNQLHRSPGIDFAENKVPGDRILFGCRVLPERGSWIEMTVGRNETVELRIDQSSRLPATLFLRAMLNPDDPTGEPPFDSDSDIVRAFHQTKKVSLKGKNVRRQLAGKLLVGEIADDDGNVVAHTGEPVTNDLIDRARELGYKELEVMAPPKDRLIIDTLVEERRNFKCSSHEKAVLELYRRLRQGHPPVKIDKARDLFVEKFYNTNRYRLGKVGRFRINRKYGHGVSPDEMRLLPVDFVETLRYLLKLRRGEGEIDDIDHLGNRQVRTLCELACEEIRKGFLKLKRTVQERMSITDKDKLELQQVINSKTVSSAIEYFFARGELSQVVDQTNPLAQLTHERRLSALGPGGLNRKRAGFEVRDAHISHYGRVCPIETPEGTNIGLINSLALFATIDQYGFLVTPYWKVEGGKVTREVVNLRADQEEDRVLAPGDTKLDADGRIVSEDGLVLARINGSFKYVKPEEVEFVDISPRQLVGVSANLIPFLEHNDVSRALMGSNMQRQAVPLVRPEEPLVVTGIEGAVARNSGMVVVAERSGTVEYVDAKRVKVRTRNGVDEYHLRKFAALNEKTCLNQRPVVKPGQRVKKGAVIADGAATCGGQLALGRNVLVAFMPWEGYNFEDAIVVSERLVKEDMFFSIHLNGFDVEIRETKLGREEFTREIPNVPDKMLANLDENGIVHVGTKVQAGDIMVGKVVPKSRTELTPEEKLLRAIFGRAGEDVKNDSLEVPSGTEGIVIETRKFSRKFHLPKEERARDKKEVKELREKYNLLIQEEMENLFDELGEFLGREITPKEREATFDMSSIPKATLKDIREAFHPDNFGVKGGQVKAFEELRDQHVGRIEFYIDERDREVTRLLRGDELPAGVLERVSVTVATMRNLAVGDKMAGRHGNKGVIAAIMPEEDMPFLEDGTPVDMVLNPLGVPSRMNLGQILETHLAWACKKLGIQAVSPIFDGYTEEDISQTLREAGLPEDGQVTLYDGRTGEPFKQKVTVGYLYMMKLHHLVDDKIHARATGPYSLITQQPLGGKARFGGQRFGEMEVWALEAYGAANTLQEILTVKSDDVDGRNRIYDAMVKGENWLESGTPVSFEVLINELKGLCLNVELKKSASDSGLDF